MRATVLLLSLLIASTPSLQAQDVDWHRFYPLEEGDTWVFAFDERECPNDPGPCSGEVERIVTRTVVGAVDVEGEARPLVRAEERLAPGAPPACTADYAVWLDPETAQVQIEPQGVACPHTFRRDPQGSVILESGSEVDDGFREEQEVMIGEVPYTLLTHYSFLDPVLSETHLTFGLDVGLVELWSVYSLSGSGFTTYTSYRLLYAEVGGVVYGTPPVTSEGETPSPTFALGAPYPNPFKASATLELSLPEAATARLEVFDVLGRRVFARDLGVQPVGPSTHVVDGRSLAPGLYVVRVTTGSGQRATRRIVRTE